MKTRLLGCLIAANSLSEIAALGVDAQRAALQNLGLANTNGALTLSAWGTNQNVNLTPSGTGRVVVGGAIWSTGNLALSANATSDAITFAKNGLIVAQLAPTSHSLLLGTPIDRSNGRIQLVSHTTSDGGIGFGTDLAVHRADVNHLVYNGSTSGSTIFDLRNSGSGYGRLQVNNSTGVFTLAALGTGGAMVFQTNGTTTALTLDASQNATFAGDVTIASGLEFRVASRLRIGAPSDGVLLLRNSGASDFARLQFGGTSNSFPALKRSGTELQVRLADDSAYAPITALTAYLANGAVYLNTAATLGVRSGTNSPEGVVPAVVGALYLRTDGGAGTTLYVKESGTGNTGWVAK